MRTTIMGLGFRVLHDLHYLLFVTHSAPDASAKMGLSVFESKLRGVSE